MMTNSNQPTSMPPRPVLVGSSSSYYRDAAPIIEDAGGAARFHQDEGNDNPNSSLFSHKKKYDYDSTTGNDDDDEQHQSVETIRSQRLEFALFLKILFRLLDVDQDLIRLQAKAMIASCLEKLKRQHNHLHQHDDHHDFDPLQEMLGRPLRSLVGDSIWICAKHYTKLYQHRRRYKHLVTRCSLPTVTRRSASPQSLCWRSTNEGEEMIPNKLSYVVADSASSSGSSGSSNSAASAREGSSSSSSNSNSSESGDDDEYEQLLEIASSSHGTKDDGDEENAWDRMMMKLDQTRGDDEEDISIDALLPHFVSADNSSVTSFD